MSADGIPVSDRTRPGLHATPRDVVYGICTLVTGAGIGWFLGMSAEPLTGPVLSAILTLLTGTAGILAGFGIATERADGATRANPVLIMVLIIGLVGGSIVGTYARANQWPWPNAKAIEHQTGIPEIIVKRRLFDKFYATVPGAVVSPVPGTADECAKLRGISDQGQLVEALRKVNNADINKLLESPTRSRLDAAVRFVCPPD